jgi:hypothetical protein
MQVQMINDYFAEHWLEKDVRAIKKMLIYYEERHQAENASEGCPGRLKVNVNIQPRYLKLMSILKEMQNNTE